MSDFLSECWSRLRSQSRVSALQGRLSYGGALSGRDQNAVTKTINGLLKLIHPCPDDKLSDDDLEWAVRLALECRRRVKEQQKRTLLEVAEAIAVHRDLGELFDDLAQRLPRIVPVDFRSADRSALADISARFASALPIRA